MKNPHQLAATTDQMAAAGPAAFLLIFLSAALSLPSFRSSSLASAANIIDSLPAIFVFGDSLSDTGNAVFSSNPAFVRAGQLPYGETFPGWPTGRLSDGHVLVDLLASYMGLPLLNPYLNSSADFKAGVNYAVGGATALNVSFLSGLGVYPATSYSLDVQLSWHLGLQANGKAWKGKIMAFTEGLYVIEVGGNDYIYSYVAEYSPSFVITSLIPLVIKQIRNAVETLLHSGAKHFLLINITPLGCSPAMLSLAYGVKDANGCLEGHNKASYLHGTYLKEEVAGLRMSFPHASFLLMDFYGAYDYVLNHKETFGFLEDLKACCGAGQAYPYNFDWGNQCNAKSVSLCSDPNKYMVWDGEHLTDSLNFQIFNQTFIMGTYIDFPYAHQ